MGVGRTRSRFKIFLRLRRATILCNIFSTPAAGYYTMQYSFRRLRRATILCNIFFGACGGLQYYVAFFQRLRQGKILCINFSCLRWATILRNFFLAPAAGYYIVQYFFNACSGLLYYVILSTSAADCSTVYNTRKCLEQNFMLDLERCIKDKKISSKKSQGIPNFQKS